MIMEQKLVRMPFDLELAKKITNKEVEGRIVTRNGQNARILCFDRKGTELPIVALVEIECGVEDYFSFYINGDYDTYENNGKDLMLEIPEYTTFKDGDILICECGTPFIYKDVKGRHGCVSAYVAIDLQGKIFFDIKDWTYSIKGRADEAQCEVLIDALKDSKEPNAKEYLKRFFGIEKKEEYEFKPFDKVLVRDSGLNEWRIDIFREYIEDGGCEGYRYNCFYDNWNYCIPYNEQTAHLLGTTEDFKL